MMRIEAVTREEAQALAAKREQHKPKHLLKNWSAVHDPVKGWHVALRADPRQEEIAARLAARNALRRGDMSAFIDAAGDALLARVRQSLAEEPSHASQ
jgi:hypothetical protein